jgi:hypothetical protein
MTPDKDEWQAPNVEALTEADGASTHPNARIRNGGQTLIG